MKHFLNLSKPLDFFLKLLFNVYPSELFFKPFFFFFNVTPQSCIYQFVMYKYDVISLLKLDWSPHSFQLVLPMCSNVLVYKMATECTLSGKLDMVVWWPNSDLPFVIN